MSEENFVIDAFVNMIKNIQPLCCTIKKKQVGFASAGAVAQPL
jgi:hypothetical protein